MKTILIFLFSVQILFGQTIVQLDLIKQTDKSTELSDSLAIVELLKIKRNWEVSNFQKDSSYAKIYHYLGRYHRNLGLENSNNQLLLKAVEYTKTAIQVNSQKNSAVSEANLTNSYFNLGLLLSDEVSPSNLVEGKKFLLKAIEIGQKYTSKLNLVCSASNKISKIYINEGDYQKALQYANFTTQLAEKIKDSEFFITSLQLGAEALRNMGKYDEAEKKILKLINLDKNKLSENELITLANIFADLAILSNKKGNTIMMKKYFKSAIESNKKANSDNGISIVYNNWGFLVSEKNDDILAQSLYEKAMAFVKNPFLKARILDNMSVIYLRKKDFPKSLKTLNEAFATLKLNIGNNIADVPDSKSIRNIKNKGYLLELIENKGNVWLEYYKQVKNKEFLTNALKTYTTADKMIDIMRWEHSGEQSKVLWRDKTRKIYENAIETCFLLNLPEDAFCFFEKSRAVILNDKLKELGAKQLLSAADLKKETEVQQKLDETRKLVFENNSEENQRKLLTVETNQINFIKQLETQNPAYYQYKYDTTSLKIADVRTKILAKNQSLVEYFIGNEAIYAIVITLENAKIYKIKDNLFTKNSLTLMNIMANEDSLNKNFTKYLSLSNQFYKKYIEPLNIPKGRVVVSSDGNIVPFSALSYSEKNAQWLLKDYIFSNTYSAKFLLKEKTKSTFQSKSFLGVAPINFANNPIKLTNADVSLKRIAEQFSSPKLLLNKDANRQSFISQMADYQIVQLYTHAIANDTLSQLYFSDSTLKANELTTNKLVPTQLIVLSACQTAVGKDAKGEGVFSLARSFATLGIPSMLTTLWQVDNEATYQLTELFYKYLKQGLPKDEAINKAQNEYLTLNQSSKNLPNYWVGMILIGDSSPIASNNWFVSILFGGLLFFVLGIWFWRKKKKSEG